VPQHQPTDEADVNEELELVFAPGVNPSPVEWTSIIIIFIYLLHKKVAKKCKHKTHTKYDTSIGQNKHILDMNSLCKKLPNSKLDRSNSLP